MYCSVSGSLVRPGSQPEFVSVRGQDQDELICGSLYRCCWPCSCDVMKFVQALTLEKTFNEKTELINVLTIKNPCEKSDFPEEAQETLADITLARSVGWEPRVSLVEGLKTMEAFLRERVLTS